MTTTQTTDEYQEPPADATTPPPPAATVPGPVINSTLRTLDLLDQFFRHHAGAATRAELQHFAHLQGWDPVHGAAVLIDTIGLDVHRLTRARDDAGPDQH